MSGRDRSRLAEDAWHTRMGAWFPGERVVFRGRDLFHELQDIGWMGLLLYGATGRLFDDNQVRLFEGIWTLCSSYPDPRIWNNRIAALAGTARSTPGLAMAAANAASEATIYGGRPMIRAFDFLLRARTQLEAGESLEQIVRRELHTRRVIPGYGRPVSRRDERIEPVMAMARQLGFDQGTHLRLAFNIEAVLQTGRWRMQMNAAAIAAALAADQDVSSREYSRFMALCFSAGILPCFIDANDQPEGSFFPLRCARVQYHGPARRRWKG